MPRKSSFLMGFETGSDLYSRGFSQAQSLAQMKLQADEKKYQRGRDTKSDVRLERLDKLAADAQELRSKKTTFELGQLQKQAKFNEEKRTRDRQNRLISATALKQFTLLTRDLDLTSGENPDHYQMYLLLKRQYLPEIGKSPEIHEKFKLVDQQNKGGSAASLYNASQDQNNSEILAERKRAAAVKAGEEKEIYDASVTLGLPIADVEQARKLIGDYNRAIKAAGRGEDMRDIFPHVLAPDHKIFKDIDSALKTYKHGGKITPTDQKGIDIARIKTEEATNIATDAAVTKAIAERLAKGRYSTEQTKYLTDSYTELRKDPTIKMAAGGQVQFAQMEEVFKHKSADEFTPSDDLGFVFMFMKALDPQSVVRESEFKSAARAEGIPDRINNVREVLLEGKVLTPSQRKEFLDTARNSVTGMQRRALKVISSYTSQMEELGLGEEKFQPVRDMIGLPPARTVKFNTVEEANEAVASGSLELGTKVEVPMGDGRVQQSVVGNPEEKEKEEAETPATPTPQEPTKRSPIDYMAPQVPATLEASEPAPPNLDPEDNQFEEDARETTRWAPHATSETEMKEGDIKPPIPETLPTPRYTDPRDYSIRHPLKDSPEAKFLKEQSSFDERVTELMETHLKKLKALPFTSGEGGLPDKIKELEGMISDRTTRKLEPAESVAPASAPDSDLLPELEDSPAMGIPPLPRDKNEMVLSKPVSRALLDVAKSKELRGLLPTFEGFKVTAGPIKGVITGEDETGIWLGETNNEKRFLPWSEVIKLLEANEITR